MGCPCSKNNQKTGSIEEEIRAAGYALTGYLARNHNRSVYSGSCLTNNSAVVLKRFCTGCSSEGCRELEKLRTFCHKNIVTVSDSFYSDRGHFYLVTPALDTDMFNLTQERGGLDEYTLCVITSQVVSALKYMKSVHSTAHGDISPENICVNRRDLHTVLIDFADAYYTTDSEQVHYRYHGKLSYMPPEALTSTSENLYATDMWSLGVTMLTTLLCRTLYNFPCTTQDPLFGDFLSTLTEGLTVSYPPTSTLLLDVLGLTLNLDPSKRVSVEKLADHEWLCVCEKYDS